MQDVNLVNVYVRQSKNNAEGIARQIERCEAEAARRGWVVAKVYDDNATSASKARKPGSAWSKMLESPVKRVLAVDVDRLLRSLTDLIALTDAKVMPVTVDGEIDLTTADGEFRATMLAAIARFEVRRKSERQKRANEYRRTKDDGALPVAGKRRYGFQKGNLLEDPVEAPRVREAFQSILMGNSVYSVGQDLGLGIDTVRGMLRNPAYAGWLTKGTYAKGRRVTMEKFEAHSSVARVVDRDTWEKVQAILDTKVRTSPGNKITHLLSGLITCAVCEGVCRYNGTGYRCKVGHVFLDGAEADREAIEELLYVLRKDGPAVEAPELVELNVAEAELERQRTVVQTLAQMPGANLDQVARDLMRLSKELEAVAESKRAHRLSAAKQDLSNAVLEAWDHDGWEQDALDAWVVYFRSLPLDQQRELVKDNLTIRLDRGRVLESLTVAPKV